MRYIRQTEVLSKLVDAKLLGWRFRTRAGDASVYYTRIEAIREDIGWVYHHPLFVFWDHPGDRWHTSIEFEYAYRLVKAHWSQKSNYKSDWMLYYEET